MPLILMRPLEPCTHTQDARDGLGGKSGVLLSAPAASEALDGLDGRRRGADGGTQNGQMAASTSLRVATPIAMVSVRSRSRPHASRHGTPAVDHRARMHQSRGRVQMFSPLPQASVRPMPLAPLNVLIGSEDQQRVTPGEWRATTVGTRGRCNFANSSCEAGRVIPQYRNTSRFLVPCRTQENTRQEE
ncbi:hypothetical protein CC85DRAFT_156610 [Cutaneotrichosporon oleaginosum]|uniref:Uncharacterized protein n=1 Tax=Cutaneotrichosporon oleaginosum TaxID=879819 RepID=A0A0J0XH23_9TREE|nr:uncharacterized protein CC85DRAFT_156610 [Cutaneotrichosporon oleaginosum]KLT40327.1 hypothetical protein CC85DRAFT_156610 [Cutaneotrichosporon oleaginosum]TXT06508.1 hypothetical protein COLE_05839 [Cutaneotrichosporon oleaginosum]